jgi:hypothetical protein
MKAKTTLNVDPRHGGIRLAALLGFFGGFIVTAFYIVPALFDFDNNLLPGALGGAAVGFALSWAAENLLIYVWPSGRTIILEPEAITIDEADDGTTTLDLDQKIDAFAWSFPIESRRSWVPRGWYCVAMRLMQGKSFFTPYSFVSPKQIEEVPHNKYFTELISRKAAEKPGNDHLMEIFHDQVHLRAAEDDRWREGAELVAEDFLTLMRHLEQHAQDWPYPLERR